MKTLVDISKTSPDQPATIRVPEIEKGVGCDFDSYLLVPDHTLDARIAAAKARLGKNVIILGHHYQRDEVVKFADFRGDSLKLSQQAASTDAKYIVFCGVHFMAESADILSRPGQVTILPDLNAGCSMADMADIGQVEACWEELESVGGLKVIPVTYMNSTAAIKGFTGEHGGAVCTSSNADKVIRFAFEHGERVLFLPDEHLGRNTAFRMGIPLDQMVVWDPFRELGGNTPEQLRNAKMILWKGYCSVHQRFLPEHVDRAHRDIPGVKVIVHPECRFEVVQKADMAGSTEQIAKIIRAAEPGSKWVVGTEIHLVNRLSKELPDRTVQSLDPNVCVCTTMFRISPQHLLWTLDNLCDGRVVNQIVVDEATKRWARVALERMLSLV
ncbi:MAG: quinolinate synthase NadA [Acidobacteria bacterium]|nr:quinolinate synthase NadA [Acidobacteriota bacterium]MCL5288165.1 quinolinate synthase NadA [Acidobacteriota bacterium]